MDATFFDALPKHLHEREAALLEAVKQGGCDQIAWIALESEWNGHRGELFVASDALRIAGVRINASAALTQLIADATGHLPVTGHVLDLRHKQAKVIVPPCNRAVTTPALQAKMTSVEWMLGHSRDVDSKIVATGRPDDGSIVSTVGKVWLTLCNDLLQLGNTSLFPVGRAGAVNYGWHRPDGTMVQTRGHKHDRWHSDYSQVVVLMLSEMLLDGVKVDVISVAQDPATAPLVTGSEGALKILRQPGVPFGDTAALAPPNIS